MKTFNLLEGKVQLSNTKLEVTQVSNWSLIKNKLLSVVAGMYIFDRTSSKIDRGFDSIWDIVFTSLIYVPLSLFIGYWLYKEFIVKSWTNTVNVDTITSITETIDEENPLNIVLTVNGKFSTVDLPFRKSEKEHVAFLESLQKLNSRYVVKQETI
ncbi:hypothetical protein H2O64_22825 [Kordia sp. YSTF-M3]|uniref:YcxB-like protein domain-containing protein n=1 Tax=Kordia aestuariivivens TaxID=2759037 RepID=A0ABR7QG27_9FLAO|nr:hypothetical protein [Kordia aestuariivivens]MBC8757522.1 hypothetical protein [Kordia aestuariivivens]